MSEKDMKEINRIFSEKLLYYLETNNMTQADLAHKLGVSTASVTYWIRGTKSPRMDKVDAMCKIFGCKRSDFMDDTPRPAAPSLSSEEEAHLSCFRRLDQEDRLKVQGFTEGLLLGDKYK